MPSKPAVNKAARRVSRRDPRPPQPQRAGGKTVAVFTRLTEPDLRTLRHLARLAGTTPSSIIRELTESWISHEREARRKAANGGGAKTNRKASK